MWLEEPFIPKNPKHSLSSLSINGFRVGSLLDTCKERYLGWHRERLKKILQSFDSLNQFPHILVFPEGSIPYQCLDIIKSFSHQSGAAVFSGTHTFQDLREAKKKYLSVGVSEKTIQRFQYKKDHTNGIAPTFINDKVHLIKKKILAPFENTDVADEAITTKPIVPFKVRINDKKVSILLLICAEALNFPKLKIKGDYDLSVIMSYDHKPQHFESVCKILSENQKVVLYCNDGKFGGSEIRLIKDDRRPIWWFESILAGKLPQGDSIIVADIDLDSIAVQYGVSDPKPNFKLIRLASLVYAEDHESSNITTNMNAIKHLEDNTEKAKRVNLLIDSGKGDALQNVKLRHLAAITSKGHNVENWWNVIGYDIKINLPSLNQLEAELGALCYSKLSDDLLEYNTSKTGYDNLRGFLNCARKLTGRIKADKLEKSIEKKISIINRDIDAKSLISFFDDTRQKIAQISGFQQIGKSSVIEKALQHFTFERVLEITIFESSSAEYLLQKLFSNQFCKDINVSDKNFDSLLNIDFTYLLKKINILWIHNSENLTNRGAWRNSLIQKVVERLIHSSETVECKIIFETRIGLPLEHSDPNLIFRRRIFGLERQLIEHGIAHLDYQLRRVGISPKDIDYDSKKSIVEKLGGHPIAVALCADAIVEEGLSDVFVSLKKRRGFFINYVNGILKKLDLNSDEKTILKLLSTCRISVPRETILQSFDHLVISSLKNLMRYCVVEIDSKSNIRIAGLLRSYFNIDEVDPIIRKKFHISCAEFYEKQFNLNKTKIEYAIEGDIHNALGGKRSNFSKKLYDGQYELAKSFYRKHKFRRAKDALDVIPVNKQTRDILRLSSLIDAKCNQFDTSMEKAKKVFMLNRKDTYLLSQISRAALSQGRDDIAEKLIETAKAANMEDTSILIVSGRMFLRRNMLAEAEAKFEKALQLTIRNPWPYFYLGRVNMRAGDLEKAIEYFHSGEKFIYENNLRGGNALIAIQTQLGISYFLNGDYEYAEQIIGSLYEHEKENPEVIRAYAIITIKKEGVDKAFEAFQRLSEGKIKSRTDRAQFHLYYGIFYLGIGDKGKASSEFSKAHIADKNNVYIMMRLANTYYELAIESYIDGDLKVSESYAKDCGLITKKILEFDADNERGQYIQIDLYSKFGIELSKL